MVYLLKELELHLNDNSCNASKCIVKSLLYVDTKVKEIFNLMSYWTPLLMVNISVSSTFTMCIH